MGIRQARAAEFEDDVAVLCEYQISLIPGLLQLPAYSEARVQADPSATAEGFDPTQALLARQKRQELLTRDGGPIYDVVIDELAIRRLATTTDVMQRQLAHLLAVATENSRIAIRALPIAAHIVGQAVPRSAFSIYQYHDPDDPVVVVIDTMTQDLIITEPPAVGQYRSAFERLRAASYTPEHTRRLLFDLTSGDRLQPIGQS